MREEPGPEAQPLPLLGMFNEVPARYDLVNRAMTLGLDRRWRLLAAQTCLRERPRRVLDLCTGTGDLALALAEAAGSGVEVVAVDFSRPMLDRAAFKIRDARRSVTLVRASAAALPFGAGTVDVVGTSFALRKLVFENPFGRAHLAEIARVLRPGGRFVAVETSQPASPVVRRLYHLFLQLSSRRLGGLLSGVPPAYGYLARSATRFPGPAGVRDLLLSAGFRSVTSRALLLGAVALHEAVV